MASERIVNRRVAVVMALVLLTCAASQAEAAKKKTYASPLGNFSVPIPTGVGQRVQQENDSDGGMVAFHDDLGSFRSIFYLRLSPASLELRKDPEAHRANLEKFFNEYAMTWLFKPAAPDVSVLHHEHSSLGEDSAYIAIVDLPGGSTMFDARTRKRHDTKRGVLIFTKGPFLYMVSSGENPSVLDLGDAEEPLDKLLERERAKLVSFISTITFE